VGYHEGDITNCYSTGAVTGSIDSAGVQLKEVISDY